MERSLYRANLRGISLFKAAFSAGHLQGESVYAQCLYCRDMIKQQLYKDHGYTSIYALTAALWDWSERKTHEMYEIAERIENFPKLKIAFKQGRLSWTKLRLILRQAQPEDENRWLGKIHYSYRQLETEILQNHPEFSKILDEVIYGIEADADASPTHSQLQLNYLSKNQWLPEGKVRVTFDLAPDQYLLWEKAIEKVKKELYEDAHKSNACQAPHVRRSFREVVGALARGILDQDAPRTQVVAPAHICLNQCQTCKRVSATSTQLGNLNLPPATTRHLTQSRHIPTPTLRKVLTRDHHKCAVPGCKNRLWLQIHHLHPWAQGGTHELDNLITLCGTHHRLLHEGKVMISREKTGEFVFQDRHEFYIGFPHVRDRWPKKINVKSRVEKNTEEEENLADSIFCNNVEAEKHNPSREDPFDWPKLQAELEEETQEFLKDCILARKKMIPGYLEYESLLDRAPI